MYDNFNHYWVNLWHNWVCTGASIKRSWTFGQSFNESLVQKNVSVQHNTVVSCTWPWKVPNLKKYHEFCMEHFDQRWYMAWCKTTYILRFFLLKETQLRQYVHLKIAPKPISFLYHWRVEQNLFQNLRFFEGDAFRKVPLKSSDPHYFLSHDRVLTHWLLLNDSNCFNLFDIIKNFTCKLSS